MSSQKIKFGDKEVDKKEFYSSKEAILLDSVDLSKIVVSSKWKINDTTYKYFCGYLNNDVIQPLCVNPIRDDKYIMAKLKIFKNVNMTTFTNNVVPIEKTHYTCISAIDIDSVLKIEKRAYHQAYLEQCKYKLKKRKSVNFIDFEIIDYASDSDSENDNENKIKIKSKDEKI